MQRINTEGAVAKKTSALSSVARRGYTNSVSKKYVFLFVFLFEHAHKTT